MNQPSILVESKLIESKLVDSMLAALA